MNPDKLRELAELLREQSELLHEQSEQVPFAGVELVSLRDLPGAAAPDETGATLLDNARIKAGAARAFTGLAAVADDTGLEVDALGGWPGVHSARYAGPGATYDANVRRLLDELRAVPEAARTARFRTVCVAMLPDGGEVVGEGVLEGRITGTPRGEHGFGYDPVFELVEGGRTLAELPPAEKQRRSHRSLAVRDLFRRLRERLSEPSDERLSEPLHERRDAGGLA